MLLISWWEVLQCQEWGWKVTLHTCEAQLGSLQCQHLWEGWHEFGSGVHSPFLFWHARGPHALKTGILFYFVYLAPKHF